MNFRVIYSLLLLLIQPLYADWDSALYNPKPDKDDVTLPMPCGGHISFRKVETEASGLYGDQSVRMGDANTGRDRYKSNPVNTYIAGNFSGHSAGRRYYLIGKYELTQLQYAVIMSQAGSDCPEVSVQSGYPKTHVNWFDAVEFTKRYSLWLHKQYSLDKTIPLPKKDNEIGFIRLPTEVEWEYATRGGLMASSQADFLNSTFFPEGETARYAWYAGSDSANGKLHSIGLLKPNPLGIYDLLGNVDELVFDLFRLSHQRLGHLHGESGGYVVRGGQYNDDDLMLYSARRDEVPFFRRGKLRQSPTTGFRVVVSSPVITGANIKSLPKAWENLSLITPPEAKLTSKKEEPIYRLVQLGEKMKDKALKRQINELSYQLNAQKAKYDEQLNRAAREALRTTAILCQRLNLDLIMLQSNKKRYSVLCEKTSKKINNKICVRKHALLLKNQKVSTFNKKIYEDAVINLSSFGISIISRQRDNWIREIEMKEFTDIKPYAFAAYSHVEQYISNQRVESVRWHQKCQNMK